MTSDRSSPRKPSTFIVHSRPPARRARQSHVAGDRCSRFYTSPTASARSCRSPASIRWRWSAWAQAEHFEPGLTDIQMAIFRMTDDSVVRITCSFANSHWGNHRQSFMGTEATFDTGWIGKDEPKFRYAGGDFTIPDNLPLGTNFPGCAGNGCARRSRHRRMVHAGRLLHGNPHRRPGAHRCLRRHHVQPAGHLCGRVRCQREARPVAIPQYQLQRKA